MASDRPTARPNPPKAATAPVPKTDRVKVRATSTVYYDHARRRPGDVFICDKKDINPDAMEIVSASTPESITTAQGALDQAHDDILAGKVSTNAGADSEVI